MGVSVNALLGVGCTKGGMCFRYDGDFCRKP